MSMVGVGREGNSFLGARWVEEEVVVVVVGPVLVQVYRRRG